MRYFADNKNNEVLKDLKEALRKYDMRLPRVAKRLRETGQQKATPKKYKIEDLLVEIENKHQVNSLIKHMDKVRVSALGDKVDGKYENVIEGKKGAMILKVEHEKMKRDLYNINRKKKRDLENTKAKGLRPELYESAEMTYEIDDLQQGSLLYKKNKISENSFVLDFFQRDMEIKRSNMIQSHDTVFGSNGNVLNDFIRELSNNELDYLIRQAGSKISFDFIYGDHTDTNESLTVMLFYYEQYLGKERYEEILMKTGNNNYIEPKPNPTMFSIENDRARAIQHRKETGRLY